MVLFSAFVGGIVNGWTVHVVHTTLLYNHMRPTLVSIMVPEAGEHNSCYCGTKTLCLHIKAATMIIKGTGGS